MIVYRLKVEYGAAFPEIYLVVAKTPKIAIDKALQAARRNGFERPSIIELQRLGRAI